MSAVPLKYSTLAMLPSLSVALAVKVKLAGAFTAVLLAGAVMLTLGAALEITATAVEVVALPNASVALAVRL